MKKWIWLLCVTILTILCISTTAASENGSCGVGVTWTLDDEGLLTISGTGEMTRGSWIGNDVKRVVIESGVTSIGENAFINCNFMTSITIPSSVRTIGDNAFISGSINEIHISDISSWLSIQHGNLQSHPNKTYPRCHLYIDDTEVTSIEIPNGVNNIRECAFASFSELTEITIPNRVLTIGKSAFSDCISLESITIPDSVTYIGESAFLGCSGLSAVTIPAGVTDIGDATFSGCSSLSGIVLPYSLSSIGYGTFLNCTSLTDIIIPDNVTEIGASAFSGCSSLAGITIPNGVTGIGGAAFYGAGLTDVYYVGNAEDRESISVAANNVPLENADWHYFRGMGKCGDNVRWQLDYDGLLTISGTEAMCNYYYSSYSNAPWDPDLVTDVVIGDGVTYIGNYALYWVKNLRSLVIPDSLESLGSAALGNNRGTTRIYAVKDSAGARLISENGYSFRVQGDCFDLIHKVENGEITGTGLVCLDADVTTFTIPSYIDFIEPVALYQCASLSGFIIPDYVTSVCGYSYNSFVEPFDKWDSLTSLVLHDSFTYISPGAFFDCKAKVYAKEGTSTAIALGEADIAYWSIGHNYQVQHTVEDGIIIGTALVAVDPGLSTFTVPESIDTIAPEVFKDCTTLSSVSIPDSVVSIGDAAFYGSGLASVIVPDTVTTFGTEVFSHCSNLTSVVLPRGLQSLPSSTFFYCTALKTVDLPENITSIGNYCFCNCSGINDIFFPEHLTMIGNNAFFECSGLKSIRLPDSVLSIGNYAFYYCSSLETVYLPDNMTSIGDGAFKDLSAKKYTGLGSRTAELLSQKWDTFRVPGTKFNLRYTYTDSTFEEISGVQLLSADKDIVSVEIPNYVTEIYDRAFYGCDQLKRVVLTDSVKRIGYQSFGRCTALEDIDIPDSVLSLGTYAFTGCRKLSSAKLPSQMTAIPDYLFYNCNSLEHVIWPDNVQTIGASAFSGSFVLNHVTIPESVTNIGDYAFGGCVGLESVLFRLQDGNIDVTFGENPFYNISQITFYCYEYTAPDIWCSQKGVTPVYLFGFNTTTIRSVSLMDGFTLACGDQKRVYADVFPADGAQVSWSVTPQGILTVADGLITAVSPGTATITATVGSVSDTMTVVCYAAATSIELSSDETWLQAKDSIHLSAFATTPANALIQSCRWESSDTDLAYIVEDETGALVKTIKPGDVTITATTEKGVSAECLLHLCYPVQSIEFDNANTVNKKLQLKAVVTTQDGQTYENKLVAFTSSNESILTVDQNGMVYGNAAGMATVTATAFNGEEKDITLTVATAIGRMILPENLRIIEDEAFANVKDTVIYLPNGIEYISASAFDPSVF